MKSIILWNKIAFVFFIGYSIYTKPEEANQIPGLKQQCTRDGLQRI